MDPVHGRFCCPNQHVGPNIWLPIIKQQRPGTYKFYIVGFQLKGMYVYAPFVYSTRNVYYICIKPLAFGDESESCRNINFAF
jgi:hypothetical protein